MAQSATQAPIDRAPDAPDSVAVTGAFQALRELSYELYVELIEPIYVERPEGLLAHIAWAHDDGGARVFDVWASEEAQKRFADRLEPLLMEAAWAQHRNGWAAGRNGEPLGAWPRRLARWWGLLREEP